MASNDEFSFVIDAFTPATLPMSRLALYLKEFSTLLGNEASVHFEGVGSGSAALKARSDPTASPKIATRLDEVVAGTATKAAMKAHANLDDLLAADNAIGHVAHGAAKVIEFPGRRRAPSDKTGPIRRQATLDGQIFQIGGKDDTINVHLRDGDKIYHCEVSINLARKLAPHFLAGPIRLFGEGDWQGNENGWTLISFTAMDFLVLDDRSFVETVDQVRGLFHGVTFDCSELAAELRNG